MFILRLLFICLGVFFSQVSSPHALAQQPLDHRPSSVDDGPPKWLATYSFDREFTFVRLRYDTPPMRWSTDFPDADINLSKHLGKLTTLRIDLDKSCVLRPEDPSLTRYPFAYLSANGIWELTDQQATSLFNFAESGGFLMIDDSWGTAEWSNIVLQMKKVFPEIALKEIPLSHDIFHCVYEFDEKPQVVSIHQYLSAGPDQQIKLDQDSKQVSYSGITDDDGRLMVLVCHNTDLADGWERAGQDPKYSAEYSEQRAFPMGVNIVFYALTNSKLAGVETR